jgi:phosphatidylglycerophosphatase A
VRKKIIECLATGLYLGKAPKMPGTFGTLLGVPLAWALAQGGPIFYMIASIVAILLAVAIAELYERQSRAHDPGEVVIDEVVGYLVAFALLPITWQSFALAFALFRAFDILKPFPISYLDRKVEGGLGTVVDDVAAGLAASLVTQVIYANTTWLGAQANGI